jgi:hypothetical protein
MSLPIVLSVLGALVHCGGAQSNIDLTAEAGPSDDASVDNDDPNDPHPPFLTTTDKVDVLFVVDNSSSMGDKANMLASSIDGALRKIAPLADLHVGVVTTSLGSMGGDVCPNTPGPFNGQARLSTAAPGGGVVASAATNGFLSSAPGGDVDALVKDAQDLVNGVGQTGCGFEAQLESMYHFLSAPDPWSSIVLNANQQAEYKDVDNVLLAQRAAFLRPDSIVSVILLTDEDDSNVDPLSLDGQGWAFVANQFPGSQVFRSDGKTTTAPRGTSACAVDPGSPDCTSCGLAQTCNPSDAACQKIKSDPNCLKNGGYYGPTEDQLNVRFFHMKERYGIDPQYPVERYIAGLSNAKVPAGKDEHGDKGVYVGTPSCRNPLFALSLPKKPGDDLCNVPRGARPPEFVIFTLLGGVPNQLIAGAPDWTKIVGENPDKYDLGGTDPHMLQSILPRPTLPGPASSDTSDPISGREWDTQGDDLQYACIFTLPTPRTCTPTDASCDCGGTRKPPLCNGTQQIKAKAYPTIRELRVAKALGERAIVGSVCATSPTTYYTPTLDALGAAVSAKLKK